MKTIKFRAWDKQINKWYKPTNEAYKGNLFEVLIGFSGDLVAHTMTGLVHESMWPDRFELMQFTGLKDKNGVEVFENDIVEMRSEYGNSDDDYRDFDLTYTGRIVVLPSLGVCIRNPKIFNHITGKTSTYSGYKTIAAYRSVKIGNIYENPELL